VKGRRKLYDTVKERFLRMRSITDQTVPTGLVMELERYVNQSSEFGRSGEIRPLASNHKAQIINWMMYWPYSFAWACLHDLVIHIYESCYESLSKIYQKISDHAWKGAEVDAPTK